MSAVIGRAGAAVPGVALREPVMRTIAQVELRLETETGVRVVFADSLEVSLDCHQCERTRRTVVFPEIGAEGRCTPTGHPFPGAAVRKRVMEPSEKVGAAVVYDLEYEYRAFHDVKEGVPSVAHPTWARVCLTLTCPACRKEARHSVQNNAARPCRFSCPACGCRLYHECEEMPVFRLLDPQGAVLREQTVSDLAVVVHASEAAPEVVRELAQITADTPGGVRRKLEGGQPVFRQECYRIRNPVVSQAMLEGAIVALARADLPFSVLSSGRDVTELMRRRHLKRD